MGIFQSSTGRFHLVLSLRFPPPAGGWYDLSRWEKSFQHASDMLYHATDGQHALGNLYICPDSLGSYTADGWLFDASGSSSADGRIWLPGTHMVLMKDERFHPFVVLHELSHYLYGLRDEYKHADGTSGALCIGRRPPTPEEIDANPFAGPKFPGACIMEGQEFDGDWFSGATLVPGTVTDFCVECNHDQGPTGSTCADGLPETDHDDVANDTRQSDTYQSTGADPYAGTSCWSVMKKHYPSLLLPIDRPDPDASTPAPPTIGWIELLPFLRFVFCIDHSKEFHKSAPWAWAPLTSALSRWIRHAPRDERLGVVAISKQVRWYPLARLNALIRRRMRKFISRLTPQPGTDLYRGLKRAIRMITRDGDRSCTQVVVLISGSRHRTGPEPLDLLPKLQEKGIRVFGLAIGRRADVARLSALCAGTGGKWYRVRKRFSNGMSIAEALHAIYTEVHPGEGLITVDAALPGDWSADLPDLPAGADQERSVLVEENCREATFLAVDQQGQGRKFHLVDPDGKEWVGKNAASPRVARVPWPAAGRWLLRAGRGKKAGRRSLEFLASVRSDKLRMGFTAGRTHYALGEEVTLVAQVSAGPNLLGFRCVGLVLGPNGKGRRVEFENEPDGGMYTARFIADREGEYLVRCVVRGSEADMGVAGGADSSTRPGVEPAVRVSDFTRTMALTITVGPAITPVPIDQTIRLERGDRRKVRLDLGGRPWVPGVSRLHLGPGIEVTERPGKTIRKGRTSFRLKVAKNAPPGTRDGIIRNGVEGYTLPGLVVVSGKEQDPPRISPERVRLPGGFLRRLLGTR